MKRAVVFLLVALAATAEPVGRYDQSVNDKLDAIWDGVLQIRRDFDAGQQDVPDLLKAQAGIVDLQIEAVRLCSRHPRTRAPQTMLDILYLLGAHYACKLAVLDYTAIGETARADASVATTDKLEEVLLPFCDEMLWCYRHRW